MGSCGTALETTREGGDNCEWTRVGPKEGRVRGDGPVVWSGQCSLSVCGRLTHNCRRRVRTSVCVTGSSGGGTLREDRLGSGAPITSRVGRGRGRVERRFLTDLLPVTLSRGHEGLGWVIGGRGSKG